MGEAIKITIDGKDFVLSTETMQATKVGRLLHDIAARGGSTIGVVHAVLDATLGEALASSSPTCGQDLLDAAFAATEAAGDGNERFGFCAVGYA